MVSSSALRWYLPKTVTTAMLACGMLRTCRIRKMTAKSSSTRSTKVCGPMAPP